MTLAIAVSAAAATCAPALANAYHGTLVASNCAPVAASTNGTMVWYARDAEGVWNAYIGNGHCEGEPLLPSYAGNRGPAAITPEGRYVLLTTAVGWDRKLADSSPGEGSGNAIQLYDRQTGKLSTLLEGATSSQRGVIWPDFNSSGTKIVWSQMLKTAAEAPPVGEWALHVADVNLSTGTLSDNVEWQSPDGEAAFYEAYGWVPNTDELVFMSTSQASEAQAGSFRGAQLYTLPETLTPSTAPTRISPEFAPVWPGQTAVNVFHEFAHFAPGNPHTLYTSIGADTVGGDDLFSYNLESQAPDGLLGQPTRISYFGGNLNANLGTQAIPGWPKPSYTVVTTMAWVNGAWVASTCPQMLCSEVNAWRIEENTSEPAQTSPPQSPPSSPRSPTTPSAGGESTPRIGKSPAPGGETETPLDAGTANSSPSEASGHVTVTSPRLAVHSGRAVAELRCSGPVTCTGTLTLSTVDKAAAASKHAHTRSLASASYTIAADASAKVKLAIDGAARRLLFAGHGHLGVTLSILAPGLAAAHELEQLWSGSAVAASARRR